VLEPRRIVHEGDELVRAERWPPPLPRARCPRHAAPSPLAALPLAVVSGTARAS
jgi:hypothetical protein